MERRVDVKSIRDAKGKARSADRASIEELLIDSYRGLGTKRRGGEPASAWYNRDGGIGKIVMGKVPKVKTGEEEPNTSSRRPS